MTTGADYPCKTVFYISCSRPVKHCFNSRPGRTYGRAERKRRILSGPPFHSILFSSTKPINKKSPRKPDQTTQKSSAELFAEGEEKRNSPGACVSVFLPYPMGMSSLTSEKCRPRKKNRVGLAEGEMRRNARPHNIYYIPSRIRCQAKNSSNFWHFVLSFASARQKRRGRSSKNQPLLMAIQLQSPSFTGPSQPAARELAVGLQLSSLELVLYTHGRPELVVVVVDCFFHSYLIVKSRRERHVVAEVKVGRGAKNEI